MSSDKQEPLKCPRCDSLDTKFCYYNNYSTTQPRHFCKNCKRYWTAGGSLRNVPVGGGLRKNKKPSSKMQTKQSNDITSSSSADELMNFSGSNSVSSSQQQQQQPHQIFPSSNGFPYDESQLLAQQHAASSSMLLASPSSSADDDTLAKTGGASMFPSSYPNPVHNFRYFDTAAESYYGAHYNSSHALPLPQHASIPDFYPLYDHTLAASNGISPHHHHHHQQPARDSIYGSTKRQRGMAEMASHGGSGNGEISEIAVAEVSPETSSKNSIYGGLYQRYGLHHQHLHEARAEEAAASWDQSFSALPVAVGSEGQSDHPQSANRSNRIATASAQEDNGRSRATPEDEDEELGNVVNVRYPYDWDQVSEVLFGGTPDFFQMPGF